MDQYDGKRGTAIANLGHYLKTAWLAAGLTWTEDNDAEVEVIVDAIVAEAASQIKGKE